jgi:hypothetical protein
MAHPYHHSLSSVRKWGGTVADYQRIHDWFDESKKIIADFRHRALRHHAEGIFMAETIFGSTITLSAGRMIPVRWIGEQHVREDLGFIPSFADWVKAVPPEPWMGRALRLEESLETITQPARREEIIMTTSPKSPVSPIELAKAITPQWMQNIHDFDALEIHPCMAVVEQCARQGAHFWTVFGHFRTGGVDDFEDFATEAEALAFHDRLIAVYPHLADRED